MNNSIQTVRFLLLVETIGFAAAALIHAGMLVPGYEHLEARTAEGIIALVLFIGLVLNMVRPSWTRNVAMGTQAFALLGTLVGLFTIAIGVGPRTTLDLAIHAGFVFVLVWGLIITSRMRS